MAIYFLDSATVTWTFNSTTGEATANVPLIGGGIFDAVDVSSTGNISALAAETLEKVTTGASTITRTLPAASSSDKVVITVKKVDSGAGIVVVQGHGSPAEAIDNDTAFDLSNQEQYVRLYCDGTKWHVIGNN